MKSSIAFNLAVITCSMSLSACIPGFLEKYMEEQPQASESRSTDSEESGLLDLNQSQIDAEPAQESILATKPNTYSLKSPYSKVWNALLDILVQNYNLVVVDEKNGIITTEWDKFYKQQQLYRNRLTLRLARRGGETEVYIKNSIETLRNNSTNPFQNEWLPYEDDLEETHRVVKNIAIVLNLPTPNLDSQQPQLATKPRQARF